MKIMFMAANEDFAVKTSHKCPVAAGCQCKRSEESKVTQPNFPCRGSVPHVLQSGDQAASMLCKQSENFINL